MSQIPESFHSFETDAPFSHCCDCSKELIISAETYIVQKVFSGKECIMEFALCSGCKDNLDQQMSAKSKEALYDFLFDHAELVEPPADYSTDQALEQIDECLTCGKLRSECKEYSYSGLFIGSHLIPGPMPMMICDECQDDMSENLSESTKDVKNKFYEENFPGPPSEVDLPNYKGKPMFL